MGSILFHLATNCADLSKNPFPDLDQIFSLLLLRSAPETGPVYHRLSKLASASPTRRRPRYRPLASNPSDTP